MASISPDFREEEDPLLITDTPINVTSSSSMKEILSDNNNTNGNIDEIEVRLKKPSKNKNNNKKKKKKSLSWCRLFLLTISFSGCIMVWSVEIAYGTPFLEDIGLPKSYVSYNWLLGPFGALFVQPIVGIISDYCFLPCIGRRKPWLFLGSATCAICLIIFSWSDLIGDTLSPHNKEAAKIIRISLAMSSFCVMDGSTNTLHSAIKTLVIDVVPVHQQTTANLYLSFFAGFGNTIGFVIGYIDFVGALNMKFLGQNIRPVYAICALWLIFSSGLTFFTTCERRNFANYNLDRENDEGEGEGEKKKKKKRRRIEEKQFLDDSQTLVHLIDPDGVISEEEEEEEEDHHHHHQQQQKQQHEAVDLLGETVGYGGIDDSTTETTTTELFQSMTEKGRREAALDQAALPPAMVGPSCPKKCFEKCCCCTPKSCAWCCFDFLKDFPDSIIRAYAVRFMIYFAKFFCFIYMGDYVGRSIFGGSPNGDQEMKDRFNAGGRWSSLGFGILSIFNMVNSPIINFLSGIIPIRIIWIFGQTSQFVGLFSLYWIKNKYLVLLVFYWLSFMETCCISYPYAIFNSAVKNSKYLKKYKGLTAGIFVSSQCFPEILVSSMGGLLVKWLIDTWKLESGIMITCGGICGGIALILILFIKIPDGMVKKTTFDDICCVQCYKKIKKKIITKNSDDNIMGSDDDDDYNNFEKESYETIDDDDDMSGGEEFEGEFEGIIENLSDHAVGRPEEEDNIISSYDINGIQQQQQQIKDGLEEEEEEHTTIGLLEDLIPSDTTFVGYE